MDVQTTTSTTTSATARPSIITLRRIFLVLNCIMLAVGNCGGPLLMRLYFIRGGKRVWIACWLQTGGWPVILIPLLMSYARRDIGARFLLKPGLLYWAAGIGVLIGVDNYMYAYGVNRLPVSTSALICATQLIFTSIFSFLLVKQKFTAYSINAVVLLTLGAVVLGLHTSGDRPEGESTREYMAGFLMTVGGVALIGFILPLVQVMYSKAKQASSYSLVLQVQMVICVFATGVCTIGMLINKDFQAIPREARTYELGATRYYLLLIFSPVVWQCYFLGVIGVVFYSSSLLSGIVVTCTLPLTELLAVLFYHETFDAEKGVSLFLSLWGFTSYFFGEFKKIKDKNKNVSGDNDGGDQAKGIESDRQVVAPEPVFPGSQREGITNV